MAALDQFDGRFAFADAAFADEQNAFAEYLNQHAVHGGERRQPNGKGQNNVTHKARGALCRAKDGCVIFLGTGQKLGVNRQITRDDQRRDLFFKQAGQTLFTLFGGELL